MNNGENDKVINWRKANNDNKPQKINNNTKFILKEYSKKEKEYLNKYLNISKNILNEEKLYNIIIKFDFNDQLILSEIFQILEEASDNEKDESKINNIKENKSIFVPYKTLYGITKSVYNLKNEQKPKRKILSKDKIIYKYENNKKIKNENNLDESVNKDDMSNKGIIYQKRFSNFNKIIEDYKNKKYKEENNYFFYKKNKNSYKNKYLGDKYNFSKPNNINRIISHKYYNSKKTTNENYDVIKNDNIFIKKNNGKNKEIIPKKKQNFFIKENIINFEYIGAKLNLNEKKEISPFLISNKSQLIIRASYTKYKNDVNNKKDNSKINKDKNEIKENSEPKKNFFKDNTCIEEIKLKQNDNNNKCKNFIENNNLINNMIGKKDDNNKNIKMITNSIENNNNSITNFNFLNSYSNMNLNNYYQYNNNNYLVNNKNLMFNLTNNYNIAKKTNFNNYNNININNNNHHSNNNFLLNNKIGIPFYFYPYYLKSNTNIMMSKYINMNSNINNNNVFINSFYNPQMIKMYYQGFNNFNINNEKAKYFNNLNKNFIYNSIMTPINPNVCNLLMNKIGIKFIPTTR